MYKVKLNALSMPLHQRLLAVLTFHIKIFVIPFIQAAVLMPINCEDLPNDSSLNRWFFRIYLSTLALSTINLAAAHNSYRRNTQQAVPITTHKPSVPATACLSLKYRSCSFLRTSVLALAAHNIISFYMYTMS